MDGSDVLLTLAGNPITIGVAVSYAVKLLKKTPWFPLWKGQKLLIRLTVAVLCTALAAIDLYLTGSDSLVSWCLYVSHCYTVPGASWLLESFYAYLMASAAYIHFFEEE